MPMLTAGRPLAEGSGRLQPVVVVGQQESGFGTQFGHDEAFADFGNLLGHQRRRKITRHFIERADALFPPRRYLGLVFRAGRQLAGDQANDQHDGKSHQVLHVADREGKAGRNEEKVENGNRQERGQHARAATVAHADQDHRQQKDHDDVGQFENREQHVPQQTRPAHNQRPLSRRPATGRKCCRRYFPGQLFRVPGRYRHVLPEAHRDRALAGQGGRRKSGTRGATDADDPVRRKSSRDCDRGHI